MKLIIWDTIKMKIEASTCFDTDGSFLPIISWVKAMDGESVW